MLPKDSWRPNASRDALKCRADTLATIRQFFYDKSVLEVETPIMSHFGNTDPNIESFTTSTTTCGATDTIRYLQTSPEFAMKRLLAAGVGDIYQICKVFRRGEIGSLHNSEFSLLEWYRMGFDYHQLMEEVAELMALLLPAKYNPTKINKISYRDIFINFQDIDPFTASIKELKSLVQLRGIHVEGLPEYDKNAWLDLIMSHLIQPTLDQHEVTFIYDYPAGQCALANIRNDKPPVAERFELFVNGVELANGYHELTKHKEQRARFVREQHTRHKQKQIIIPYDEYLLMALESGLQPCSGVALGIDRLIMLIGQENKLKNILAFCQNRA